MGRPRKADGAKAVTVSVTLQPGEVEMLRGRFGTVQAGLRRLVQGCMGGVSTEGVADEVVKACVRLPLVVEAAVRPLAEASEPVKAARPKVIGPSRDGRQSVISEFFGK